MQLLSAAVVRCRSSTTPTLISVLLSRLDSSSTDRSKFQFQVSDTGPGIAFAKLDDLCSRITKSGLTEGEPAVIWDGVLTISSQDPYEKKKMRNYQLKFRRSGSPQILELRPECKEARTEASIYLEGPTMETIAYFRELLAKFAILVVHGLSLEWHYMNSQGERESSCASLRQTELDELEAGFANYIHNCLGEESIVSRTHIKVGKGKSSAGCRTDACIAITEQETSSSEQQRRLETKIIYFEDFSYTSIPPETLEYLRNNVDWAKFGLPIANADYTAGSICWDFAKAYRIDFVLHKIATKKLSSRTESRMVKQAVESALHDLRAKLPHLLASPQASKMQTCVPELSRCIAGLIKSSTDNVFRAECAEIVGLLPAEIHTKLEGRLRDKLSFAIQCMDSAPATRSSGTDINCTDVEDDMYGSDMDVDYDEET